MDLKITIPDDAATTCATPDESDPVEFIRRRLQDAADAYVAEAKRLKSNFLISKCTCGKIPCVCPCVRDPGSLTDAEVAKLAALMPAAMKTTA